MILVLGVGVSNVIIEIHSWRLSQTVYVCVLLLEPELDVCCTFVLFHVHRCKSMEMTAFPSMEEQMLDTLCPVRALHVSRTAGFRKADQLFVSWASLHIGKLLSCQRKSYWIVEATSLAHRWKCYPTLLNVVCGGVYAIKERSIVGKITLGY